jgi:hypothetical protein
MLGEPTLIPPHRRGDAQREAFLAEQGVPAVPAAIRPYGPCLREMDDMAIGRVAGPGDVGLAGSQGRAHGVQAFHELAVAQDLQGGAAHAGHDAHADGHIGGVRQLHPDTGDVRAQGAHAEGHHVQGAPAHATFEQDAQLGPHLGGSHPIIGGAGVLAATGADEGALLRARHVLGMGPAVKAIGAFAGIEPDEGAALHEQIAKAIVFGLGSVAPFDAGRFAPSDRFVDPSLQLRVLRHGAPSG